MTKPQEFEASLIGCGRIGFLLEEDKLRRKPCTHSGGADKAGIKFTCACDLNKERLEYFGKKALIKNEFLFNDYRILLKEKKPDLAVIATWTETHSDIAICAAENGTRLIILEKPISYDLKSAKKILDACALNGTQLIINHERRYDARYRKVKKIIDDGIIGEIKSARGLMLTGGFRGDSFIKQGGGPLLHDGTHLIDIIRFLFGEISNVSGEFTRINRNYGFEDRACAWLKSETGIDIFIEAGGNRKYFVFELELSGTKGSIIIGNGYNRLFLNKKSSLYKGFFDLKEVKFPAFSPNNCFTELYKEAYDILKSKKTSIHSSGSDGYRSLEIIHSIYLSSYKNRKIISIPVKPSDINISKIFKI